MEYIRTGAKTREHAPNFPETRLITRRKCQPEHVIIIIGEIPFIVNFQLAKCRLEVYHTTTGTTMNIKW